MNVTELGFALREARKRRNLTLQKVAGDVGMSVATLSRLETGNLEGDITVGRLIRVGECVGLELVYRPAGFGMTLDEAVADSSRIFDEQEPDSAEGGPKP